MCQIPGSTAKKQEYTIISLWWEQEMYIAAMPEGSRPALMKAIEALVWGELWRIKWCHCFLFCFLSYSTKNDHNSPKRRLPYSPPRPSSWPTTPIGLFSPPPRRSWTTRGSIILSSTSLVIVFFHFALCLYFIPSSPHSDAYVADAEDIADEGENGWGGSDLESADDLPGWLSL